MENVIVDDITPDIKFDMMTYNAYRKIRYKYIRFNLFLAVKSLLLIVFIPIDYAVAKGQLGVLTAFMIVGLIVSLLDGFWNFALYCCSISNQRFALAICHHHKHTVSQPQNSSIVSARIYNAQNEMEMGNQGLTTDIMSRYETGWSYIIEQTIVTNSPSLQYAISLNNSLNIIVFIYGIISLAVGKPNIPQIVVLTIFLFMIFLQMIKYVLLFCLFILLLLLCPLLCCLCCICLFCVDHQEKKLNIPQTQPVTPQMINQGGQDCPICYQKFKIGQPVVVLPCSNHHIFHQLCLSGWTQISPTCPSCRHNLTS